MPYEQLMHGFWKWKECTSTSPSGHHLGIYKALLKDEYWQKSKNGQSSKQQSHSLDTNTACTSQKLVSGTDVMHMIHKMLVLAVWHCHMYKRWTKICNFFIEKDLGKPLLSHLWTLHIVEANLNLLWKWFGPQGVLK